MDQPIISVIDDDASLRRAIVALVRSLGHIAHGFASAEEFLDAEADTRSDCIITDIQMPGMSGIDLKEALDRRGLQTPVIMITARTEAPLLARAMSSGAAGLLRKPFEAEAFVQCLEQALSPA
jgi:FixJ family two-component response regulator